MTMVPGFPSLWEQPILAGADTSVLSRRMEVSSEHDHCEGQQLMAWVLPAGTSPSSVIIPTSR